MAIIDVICYNNEEEILDIRLNVLKGHVDQFIICEAPTTFSGNFKPLYGAGIKLKYPKLPIEYFVINEDYTPEEIALAENSPNTIGAKHWKREFLQKESIKKALTHLSDDDIVFIGDCDEVWEPEKALKWCHAPFKYKLRVYTYYLNNRSSEEFWGTLVSPYRDIKNSCLNHLRTNAWKTIFEAGWHFTSMAKSLKQKLKDSYTDEDYATDVILQEVDENIENDRDFLGRNFTYKKDETKWPEYLKNNKEKYKHLLKP